jgi:signal transduction histidine kinase
VFSIIEDSSGFLWVGTRVGGLNKFEPKKEKFTHYTSEKCDLSHNFVLSIYEDQNGTLWVGTYGGGLNKMTDREKGIFKSYREKDGLPNDAIYGILEDNHGNLWLSTNNGISKFNPKTKTFKNYDIDDGLQSNEFNAGAYFKSPDGKIFFGGINGFNSFFSNEIQYNLFVPPVVITDFFISNESVKPQWQSPGSPLKKVIHEMQELTLSPQQNSFSFEFALIDYTSPQKNQYKYKLDGYNENWINTDSKNRRATYTNLPSGNYVFLVTGSNSDGIWNKKATSIKIKILTPLWRTWWAYTLYLLVFIMFAYLIWSVWSKRVLKQRVEEQTKELKNIQSQLVHSEKMAGLGFLVAGVAHDINNPISFVNTSAYNLARDLDKLKNFLIELAGDEADAEILAAFDEKFETLFKHTTTIHEGTLRIKEIVKDLRTFYRGEKGEMKRIKIIEGLQSTINLVSTHYKEKVDFVTYFQADPEVEGNATELNQVFMNVIVNACKAIIEKQKNNEDNVKETKGTLTIQTQEEKGYSVISFQDTGTGISEEVLPKIFDPFFTTRPAGEGTGLGLSISYSIIQKHKGRIEVSSKKSKSTTVTLYLPLIEKKK